MVAADNLTQAFELLLFGWGGVFVVLFLLYIVSKILLKAFPAKKGDA